MEYRICQVYNSLDSEFNLDRFKPVQTGTPTYRLTGVPVRLNTLFQKIQYNRVLMSKDLSYQKLRIMSYRLDKNRVFTSLVTIRKHPIFQHVYGPITHFSNFSFDRSI